MTEQLPPTSSDWNIAALAECLLASTEDDSNAAWAAASAEVEDHFPSSEWKVDRAVNPYGNDSYQSLYNNEMQAPFRKWLQARGISAEQYADVVGAVQFVSIQVQLASLMPSARSNRGWRIRIIGYPPLRLVVCGLASHYQGTQNHIEMGNASALIRGRALEVLHGRTKTALAGWPAATPEDWEERGLMSAPILGVGSLDISDFDNGKGAKLRMIRNTTVKKELATFFAIRGMSEDEFLSDGPSHLEELRDIALDLGRPEGK